MKDIKACKRYIEKHEDRKPIRYFDNTPERNPTIGVGCNLNKPGAKALIEGLGLNFDAVRNGQVTLTNPQIDRLFDHDAKQAIVDAKKFYSDFDSLGAVRQIVLVDMAFNLGYTALSGFVKFRKALQKKNFEEAAKEMKDSEWFGQVGNRAVANVSAMKTGKMPYADIHLAPGLLNIQDINNLPAPGAGPAGSQPAAEPPALTEPETKLRDQILAAYDHNQDSVKKVLNDLIGEAKGQAAWNALNTVIKGKDIDLSTLSWADVPKHTALLKEIGETLGDLGTEFKVPLLQNMGKAIQQGATLIGKGRDFVAQAIAGLGGDPVKAISDFFKLTPTAFLSSLGPLSALSLVGIIGFGILNKTITQQNQELRELIKAQHEELTLLINDLCLNMQENFQRMYQQQEFHFREIMREFQNLRTLIHAEFYNFSVPVMLAFRRLENDLTRLTDRLDKRLDRLYIQSYGRLLATLDEYLDARHLSPVQIAQQVLAPSAADNLVSQLAYWLIQESCSDTLNGRIYVQPDLKEAKGEVLKVLSSTATDLANLTGFLAEYAKMIMPPSPPPALPVAPAIEQVPAVPAAAQQRPAALPAQQPAPVLALQPVREGKEREIKRKVEDEDEEGDITRLPNPAVWCSGVRHYLKMRALLLLTSQIYDPDMSQLQKILAVGSQYIRFIEWVQNSEELFTRLFQQYEASVNAMHVTLMTTTLMEPSIVAEAEFKLDAFQVKYDAVQAGLVAEYKDWITTLFAEHQDYMVQHQQQTVQRLRGELQLLASLQSGSNTADFVADQLDYPLMTVVTYPRQAPPYTEDSLHFFWSGARCYGGAKPDVNLLWDRPGGYAVPWDATPLFQGRSVIPKPLLLAERLGLIRFELTHTLKLPAYFAAGQITTSQLAHTIRIAVVDVQTQFRTEIVTAVYRTQLSNDAKGLENLGKITNIFNRRSAHLGGGGRDIVLPPYAQYSQLGIAINLVLSVKLPPIGTPELKPIPEMKGLVTQMQTKIANHLRQTQIRMLMQGLGIAKNPAGELTVFQDIKGDAAKVKVEFDNAKAGFLLLINYLQLAGFSREDIELSRGAFDPQIIVQRLKDNVRMLALHTGPMGNLFPQLAQDEKYTQAKAHILRRLRDNIQAGQELQPSRFMSDWESQVRTMLRDIVAFSHKASVRQVQSALVVQPGNPLNQVAQLQQQLAQMAQMLLALQQQLGEPPPALSRDAVGVRRVTPTFPAGSQTSSSSAGALAGVRRTLAQTGSPLAVTSSSSTTVIHAAPTKAGSPSGVSGQPSVQARVNTFSGGPGGTAFK